MPTFDVLSLPPTPEDIRLLRKKARNDADNAIATAVLATPLPMIDLGVGALVGGIHHVLHKEDRERLEDAPRAMDLDWSGSPSTKAYVDRVRAQGRPLVKGEVEALRDRLRMDRSIAAGVQAALGAAISYLMPART